MKPLTIKNEDGETIEIKYDADGVIKIRHSDIHPKSWGELHEYSKRIKKTDFKALMEKKKPEGVDFDSGEAKQMLNAMGGYVLISGRSYIISAAEIKLIHEAVKQSGGVIPNWSNRP